MKKPIRIALVGLTETGQTFARHLLEKEQKHNLPIKIVAVAHAHPDSAAALGFSQSGVPVFADARELSTLGENLDIIIDLSGDQAMRQQLRLALLQRQNMHTVIVSETIARLLWYSFGETREPSLNAVCS